MCSLAVKKFVLAEKIFSVQNTRTKQQNEGLRIARNMHHKDTHLCLKQTPISHLWASAGGNDAALLCVCSREEPRREYQTEQSTLRLEFFFFSSGFGAKIVFTDLSVFAFFFVRTILGFQSISSKRPY